MLKKLPNLELLQYKFLEFARNKYQKIITGSIEVITFMQTWGSTALGFDEDGCWGGQAITEEYTTIFIATVSIDRSVEKEETIYVIFFGDKMAYEVHNPTTIEFCNDVSSHKMASVRDARERY